MNVKRNIMLVVVAHVCNPSHTDAEMEGLWFEDRLSKKARPYRKTMLGMVVLICSHS
jgi:hypothetical protein